MSVKSHRKLDVATQQLETALRLYFAGGENFSVVTLAGAAEEILGVYLKRHKQVHAFDDDLKSTLDIYKWMWGTAGSPGRMHKVLNVVKNASKHMKGVADVTLRCDDHVAARRVLDRAVTNYYRLMPFEDIHETPFLQKFNEGA